MTRICIMTRAKDTVTAAFYYAVTQTKPIPLKPGTLPQSGIVDPAVVDGLTSGNLIEVVKTFNFSGWPLDQIHSYLEKAWAEGQDRALAEAAVLAEGVGTTWDGSTWA